MSGDGKKDPGDRHPLVYMALGYAIGVASGMMALLLAAFLLDTLRRSY